MITVNLYYTGIDGNARRFAEEMESSGTADKIRSEMGKENLWRNSTQRYLFTHHY